MAAGRAVRSTPRSKTVSAIMSFKNILFKIKYLVLLKKTNSGYEYDRIKTYYYRTVNAH